MDLRLTDKVVLVTGGAKGIGRAIVEGAAREGATAVIVNRKGSESEEISRIISEKGGNSLVVEADLGDASTSERVVGEVLDKLGRIDVIVNNAGKNDGIGLEHGDPERFEKSLKFNLFHYYSMVHYAIPALKASKGNIINISSKTAVTGQGGTSAYIAAKGAQLALTREWAVELLPYGIRVNAILPAEVWTPLYEAWINSMDDPEGELKKISDMVPLGKRLTSSDEIADAALFLMSERASHITGQHWYVDGGYTHLDRALNK